MSTNFFKKDGYWRSDRKLPVSFFLFFFLTFFLMGEQLVALPLYLFGPVSEGGADKVAILDLAPSDALHRPLFYLLFSFISWMLFRSLNWPIVWIGASTMWLVFKWLLPDPSKTPSIIWTFVGVGIFILTPYFIYRTVDRRWGVKGRRNAVLIVAALNILLLGFFAYQIYVLDNSYYRQTSYGSLIRNESNQQTYQSLVMIAPYTDESKISRIGPYSSTEDSPLGIKHPGIDFFPVSDMMPFLAVTGGKITNFRSESGNTQFCIDHNPFLVCYSFETFSSDDAVSQRQRDNVFVKNGDEVKQGDMIGKLIYGGDGAHVDLGVMRLGENGEKICPESYFTEEAKASIVSLIQKDHTDLFMCYVGDQATNQTNKQESRKNQSWEDTNPQTQDLIESCPENISGILTYPILENEVIDHMVPLGHINPERKHVKPISHMYYNLKKEAGKVPIFAPADSFISIGEYKFFDESGKVVDRVFNLDLIPCKELWIHLLAVHDISDNLEKMLNNSKPCEVTKGCQTDGLKKNIKAGDLIGQTAVLEIAAYDSRNISPFISPERYHYTELHGVCPIDLFSNHLKKALYGKLSDPESAWRRTIEPRCGSVAQDIPGTIQGEWFIVSIPQRADYDVGVLSIIHGNFDPLPGVIAIVDTIVPSPSIVGFTPRYEGFINREPSEVKDSKIYCYYHEKKALLPEGFRDEIYSGTKLTGRILVQLIDNKTLKIEYQEKNCDGSLNFNSPTIYER